jgi:hypothetical protein
VSLVNISIPQTITVKLAIPTISSAPRAMKQHAQHALWGIWIIRVQPGSVIVRQAILWIQLTVIANLALQAIQTAQLATRHHALHV